MIRKFALCSAAALLVATGPGLAADGAGPSDAQIAHIAYTAGRLDVAAGRQALAKSRNEAVREFARTMVRDHAAVNDQALALLRKLGVAPEANATSEALTRQAEEQARRLGGLSGAAFDKAYVENEVAYHQQVLDAIDKVLLPSAQNEELKGLITKVRPAIAAHLDHAKMLQSSLGKK